MRRRGEGAEESVAVAEADPADSPLLEMCCEAVPTGEESTSIETATKVVVRAFPELCQENPTWSHTSGEPVPEQLADVLPDAEWQQFIRAATWRQPQNFFVRWGLRLVAAGCLLAMVVGFALESTTTALVSLALLVLDNCGILLYKRHQDTAYEDYVWSVLKEFQGPMAARGISLRYQYQWLNNGMSQNHQWWWYALERQSAAHLQLAEAVVISVNDPPTA